MELLLLVYYNALNVCLVHAMITLNLLINPSLRRLVVGDALLL